VFFRYFRYRGADPETANDLASSTFEQALKNLSRYDRARHRFTPGYFAIAHNMGINHWKGRKNKPLPWMTTCPSRMIRRWKQGLILLQDKEQVLQVLQFLDLRAREILALKFGGLPLQPPDCPAHQPNRKATWGSFSTAQSSNYAHSWHPPRRRYAMNKTLDQFQPAPRPVAQYYKWADRSARDSGCGQSQPPCKPPAFLIGMDLADEVAPRLNCVGAGLRQPPNLPLSIPPASTSPGGWPGSLH